MDISNRKFYENWSANELKINYEKRKQTLLWKAGEMLKLVSKDINFRSILEIGCAEGVVLNEISKQLKIERAVGVDLSENFTKFGKKMYPNIKFINDDFRDVDFKENEFDIVVLSDIIEHIQEYEELLHKVKRIGRYIIFKIPIERCIYAYLLRPKIGKDHPSGHLHQFSIKDCFEMLKKFNFRIITYSYDIAPFDLKFRHIKNPGLHYRVVIFLQRVIYKIPKDIRMGILGGHLFAFCSCLDKGIE